MESGRAHAEQLLSIGRDVLVLEVETNEPSLFLDLAPGSANRYAAAIALYLVNSKPKRCETQAPHG